MHGMPWHDPHRRIDTHRIKLGAARRRPPAFPRQVYGAVDEQNQTPPTRESAHVVAFLLAVEVHLHGPTVELGGSRSDW